MDTPHSDPTQLILPALRGTTLQLPEHLSYPQLTQLSARLRTQQANAELVYSDTIAKLQQAIHEVPELCLYSPYQWPSFHKHTTPSCWFLHINLEWSRAKDQQDQLFAFLTRGPVRAAFDNSSSASICTIQLFRPRKRVIQFYVTAYGYYGEELSTLRRAFLADLFRGWPWALDPAPELEPMPEPDPEVPTAPGLV